MATLEKIRSHSVLLIGAIALALLCFVVGDALNNSSTFFNNSRSQVGEVEGENMSIENFQKQVSVMTNVLKQSGRSVQDGEVRDAVWNTFVQSSVLNKISEETGLSVSPLELKEAIMGEKTHPMLRQIPLLYNESNQFDPKRVLAIMDEMDEKPELKDMWMFWEKRIGEEILTEKIQTLAMNAMTAPKAQIDYLNGMSGKSVKLACAVKEYRALPDSSFIPSDADRKVKYEELKEMFKTDGARFMQSIVYAVNPTSDDYAQFEEKVKSAENDLKNMSEDELKVYISQESDVDRPYNPFYQSESDLDPSLKEFALSARKDSVLPTILDGDIYKTAKVLSDVILRPDSVKASHILVGGTSLESARNTADSLMKVLNAGADFLTVAMQNSLDKTVRQNGGDWGWIREGQFGLDTFDNVIFQSKVGEIHKFETQGGIFIVKVTDITKPVKKVRLAVVANKVVPSQETYRAVFEKANSFIAKNGTKEQFEAAAKEENLLIREIGPMSENQNNLYYLENSRPIVKWAFEANLNEVTSKPFDCKNQYVIGYVSDVIEKGYIPMKNKMVQEKLDYLVRNDLKAESIMKDMNNVSDLSSFGAIDTVTISFSDISVSRTGAEPAVIAAACNANTNDVLAPIKGERGVYAIQVLDVQDADPANNSVANKVNGSIKSYVSYSLFRSLMDNAEKTDNRSRFY